MTKSQETLNQAREELMKAWLAPTSATSGINEYDLEAPAKNLYPVITPIRNSTPRVSGKGGIQANWRAITGVNITNVSAGLEQGKRGGIISTSEQDYLAVYRGYGLDDSVTDEAWYSAEYFQDLYALAALGLLRANMIAEEKLMLGGLGTFGLGQPGSGSATFSATGTDNDSAHGGTLVKGTYNVYVVALTLAGKDLASVAGGIVQSYARTNGDGSTTFCNGGSSQVSAVASTSTIATGNGSILATVTAVPGAAAYAWYWGIAGSAITLGAITTVNTNFIIATAASLGGTQTIAQLNTANDYSQDSNIFDGLISQAAKSGSNAYYASLDGAQLSANNVGGITQIDTALQSFWDNYRLSPTRIYVNSQQKVDIRTKIMTASTVGAQRIVFESKQGTIVGGAMAVSYMNPFCMGESEEIPIDLHPNVPAGTILFDTEILPYPLSNVQNVKQMRMRRDYYQVQWPKVTRRQDFGVYADGVLQHFFPPSLGLIQNIKPG